jgi:Ca-activated chloride channel family protein
MTGFFALPARTTCVVLAALASVALCAAPPALAQSATLAAPAQAAAGSQITLSWTGPSAAQEFISIDPADAPAAQYGPYVYANRAQPAPLQMPDVPGSYLLRYHTGATGYPVIASHPIEVTDVAATFGPLAPVEAGGSVQVAWQGPGYERDFISIDPVGAPDRDYGVYTYARENPLSIRAPDAAGEYLVRYHLASSYRVIGQAALTVGSVGATLTAPAEARAGSEIQVAWQGPDASLDYISVDAEGAAEGDYGPYVYTRVGSPLALRLPEEPGRYQLRYHMGQSGAVIGTSALVILPNTATVAGPASVVGGTELEATWTGPDNQGDYVTIVPVGAEPRDYLDYAYTREGATLLIEAL